MSRASRNRTIQRWIHIISGLVLLCYIYSPFSRYVAFQIAVKWVMIPVVVISGVLLWKPRLPRWISGKDRRKTL